MLNICRKLNAAVVIFPCVDRYFPICPAIRFLCIKKPVQIFPADGCPGENLSTIITMKKILLREILHAGLPIKTFPACMIPTYMKMQDLPCVVRMYIHFYCFRGPNRNKADASHFTERIFPDSPPDGKALENPICSFRSIISFLLYDDIPDHNLPAFIKVSCFTIHAPQLQPQFAGVRPAFVCLFTKICRNLSLAAVQFRRFKHRSCAPFSPKTSCPAGSSSEEARRSQSMTFSIALTAPSSFCRRPAWLELRIPPAPQRAATPSSEYPVGYCRTWPGYSETTPG